jgi:hypothetical protein
MKMNNDVLRREIFCLLETWTGLSVLGFLSFGDFFFALLLSTSPSQESVEKKEKTAAFKNPLGYLPRRLENQSVPPRDPD